MSTSIVPTPADTDTDTDLETGQEKSLPSVIMKVPSMLVGGKAYWQVPVIYKPTCGEICCPGCCYRPLLTTYYNTETDTIKVGDKDGKKLLCCSFRPKPPKGQLHAGYQIVGNTKGTLNPWTMPCCFCCGETRSMMDPTKDPPPECCGKPIRSEKTYYLPTGIIKDKDGNPIFETRQRTYNHNICACCKCKCNCFACCINCCMPCIQCYFACKACCSCGSCCEKKGDYTIEHQPVFRAGKENTKPAGYIKIFMMEEVPFSVTVDVPGATAEENELLMLFAWALVEKSDPWDPTKVSFIRDTLFDAWTNSNFVKRTDGVKFGEVMRTLGMKSPISGGSPDIAEMER